MGISPEEAFGMTSAAKKPAAVQAQGLTPEEAFGGGTPVAKPQAASTFDAVSKAFTTVKDNAFIKRSSAAVGKAATLIKDDPTAAFDAGIDATWHAAVEMTNLGLSGIAALAKSMFTPVQVDPKASLQEQARQNFDKSIGQFTANQEKIKQALDGANAAEPSKQEETMSAVLNILPDAINSAGDTVFEKTGSALAGAGAGALLTLLTLNPEIAGKALNKISDASRTKGINTKVSASFEELAATHPEGAEALANHVEIVDSKTAKYIRGRIEALKDASESTLDEIGKRKADAEIAEMQKNLDDIVRTDNANLDPALNTGEGKGKKSRGSTASAPSGYSDLGIEPEPEAPVGLGTGEGVASPGKSRVKSGKSGYGDIVDNDYSGTSGERYDETIKGKIGPAPEELEFGLGTGEGKASKTGRAARSGPSDYGKGLVDAEAGRDSSTGAVISPERMSSSIRNSVMEGHDALAKVKGEEIADPATPLYAVNDVPVTRDDFGRFSNLDNFWDCK